MVNTQRRLYALDLRTYGKPYVQERAARMTPVRQRAHSARRIKGARDKVFFAETYFPQNFKHALTPQHRTLLTFCDERNRMLVVSAFRGWGKSTIASYLDWFHKACYGKIHVSGFGSNNQTLALQFTKAIKGYLEDPVSDEFRDDFPELVGEVDGTQFRFTTRTGVKVFAIGAGMTPRGFIDFRAGERIDWFNLDDLETDASAGSETESEDLYQWISKAIFPALRSPEDGGFYLRFIGTPITPLSVMARILKDPQKYPLRLVLPIYDEQGIPAWPEVFGLHRIQEIFSQITLSAKHSEYLLIPLSGETQRFRPEWLTSWTEEPSAREWTRTVAAADPSATKKRRSDYKTIVVCSHCALDNRVYVREVYARRSTPSEYLSAIHQITQRYQCQLYIEENFLKDWLWESVQHYEQSHRCHLRLTGVNHSTSKDARISILESPFERDQIRLPPLIQGDGQLLYDQIAAYPMGTHDDAVDALAEAYWRIMGSSDALPEAADPFKTQLDQQRSENSKFSVL